MLLSVHRPSAPRRLAGLLLLLAALACGRTAPPGGEGGPATRDAAAERGVYAPAAATLACAESEWDFGKVWEGAVLEHEFRLEVQGKEPLSIAATRSDCGCAAARLERVGKGDGEGDGERDGEGKYDVRSPYEIGTPLPPGTILALTVRYDTRGKRGDLPRKVGLYANQPGGVKELVVRATVQPWLVAEPADLTLPPMGEDEEREAALAVRSAVGRPFRLVHVRRAVPEPLRVELFPVAPDAEGRAERWEVVVRLGRGMPRGSHVYPIHLASDVLNPDAAETPEGDRPPYAAIPRLAVEVVGRYRIAPNLLDFGVVRPGEVVARSLRVTCLDPAFDPPAPAARLEPLQPGSPFPLAETAHVSVRAVAGGRAWDVQVLFDGISAAVGPRFLGRLVIETGHPAERELVATVSGSHSNSPSPPPRPPASSVR
ncbi:MAG: DUF1573 domain-containing protein [Planctomycetota bacterium]